ncbi:MAG: hypothetical protein ACI9CA_001133 [Natronomonas sp.]|jgi:hypothetical protein
MGEADPTAIEGVAVTASDLVAALETNRTTSRTAVLRVTPPFSGRMRARLHVEGNEGYDEPRPVHVPPQALVTDDAPSYPTPAETEDTIRADPDTEYTVERHRARHETAVEEWRRRLLDAVRDRATVETPAGPVTVGVSLLGDTPA